jgi:predicted component of type VI protein secretion system
LDVTDLIFVEQKPMEGREHKLSPGDTIGREGCEVVLPDPEVSRRHATIRSEGGSLAIEDLGSTNGTYVNDHRVHGVQPLKDGDVVRLGNTVWSIRAVGAPGGAGAGATSIGQVQPGAPQVTTARAVPSDIDVPSGPPAPQPTTAQPVPAAAAASAPAPPPPPQRPAEPSAPSPQQVGGRRGDVEAPPEVAPSAIRRVLPPPAPGQAPVFQPPGARPGGSAATRVEATIVCMIIVAAAAAALIIYFITY